MVEKIRLHGFNIPIRTGSRPTNSESCLRTVQSPSILNKAIRENDNTVMIVHSRNCPHCHQALPIIEEKCQEAKTAGKSVEFLECPIDGNPHCSQILNKVKSDGVPTVIGFKKNQTLKNPDWKIIGADMENIKKKINKTIGLTGTSPRAPQPQQPAPQQPPSPSANVNFGIPSSTQNVMQSLFGLGNIGKPNSRSFCIPAYDSNCKPAEFGKQLTNFLSS